MFIHQQAAISLLKASPGKEFEYTLRYPGNGTYVFVIDGKISIGGQEPGRRDAMGISGTDAFSLSAKEDSFILFLEVPLNENE